MFPFLLILVSLWISRITDSTALEPEPPQNIKAYNTSSTSIVVTWESFNTTYPSITGYKVSYSEYSFDQEVNILLCPWNNTKELKNLKVFTNYCIEVASFTSDSVSRRSQCIFTTTGEEAPTASPQNLSVFNISSTSLRVTWDPLPLEHRRGVILGYKIFYEKLDNSLRVARSIKSGERSVDGSSLSVDLVGLEKFTSYCVTALAFNRIGRGNKTENHCTNTNEDVPSQPPLNVSVYNTSSTSLYVKWAAIPSEFIPGILLGYRVFYWKTSDPSSQYHLEVLGTSQLNAELLSLEDFTEYCIQLAGFTRIGNGNKTECFYTTTDFGLATPPQPSTEVSYSPTAIKVMWKLPLDSKSGIISGFKVHITEKGDASQPPENVFEEYVLIQNASQRSVVIQNLSIFTTYQVRMATFNSKGVGNYSDPVLAETCRCPKYLPSSIKPSSLEISGHGGITELIANVIKKTCGRCKMHGATELVISRNNTSESDLRFPVTVTFPRDGQFSKFIAVLNVPGVVVLKRRGDKSVQRYYEQVMTGSLLDTWPVIVISVILMYATGVLLWFLDNQENPNETSGNFCKGAYEGFWWAFITMTTVGYGDRCPRSTRAKAFAMVWLLGSLVLLPFLMGAISSMLTVTVMRTGTSIPKSAGNNRAAAITDSAESKLARGPLSNKLKLTTTYSTVEALAQALRVGEVDYVIVDMYLPVKRKDLFNGTWFEAVALLQKEMYHGVVVQGDAIKLAPVLKEMIAFDNVQTKFLEAREEEEEQGQVDSTESLFFDPTSPFFQYILYAGLGVLCLCWICGSLYEVIYTKQRKRLECVQKKGLEFNRKELKTLVDEFYYSFYQMCKVMKTKHRRELLELGRKKRELKTKGKLSK